MHVISTSTLYVVLTGALPSTVVVDQLCMTLNNPSHVASDTVLTFADGTVYVVCRAVIASQCSELIPFLYMTGESKSAK